jgi:hypothetical protein
MCLCIYIVCMYVHMYVCIVCSMLPFDVTDIQVCVYVCTYVCMYVHMYVCIVCSMLPFDVTDIQVYVYVYVLCVCVYVCTYVCMHG